MEQQPGETRDQWKERTFALHYGTEQDFVEALELHKEERRGRCDSVEGGIRCRGRKGHLGTHWGPRNPGDSLIGNKKLYGLTLTPQARAIFWVTRDGH